MSRVHAKDALRLICVTWETPRFPKRLANQAHDKIMRHSIKFIVFAVSREYPGFLSMLGSYSRHEA